MTKYCRYCTACFVGDCVYCVEKEMALTEKQAKQPTTCTDFVFSEMDAFGEKPYPNTPIMTSEEFYKICEEYYGEQFLEEGVEGCYGYRAYNRLITYNRDGSVRRDKKVLCKLTFEFRGRPMLNGEEKTCEILGGFHGATATEENLRFYLDYYGFKKREKKKTQQLEFELWG